ncbi:MAG: phosphoribosylformylglycinamidine cyclo-ligase [Candidatus Altiarchaeota archaeon]
MRGKISYKKAGVDIDVADSAKRDMAKILKTNDKRVLNRVGAFASLYDGSFPGYEHPLLVLKTEEPGSKQKLAFQHNRISSISYDLINHLVNDIIVMGAKPLAVQDAIICGKLEKDVVKKLVENISKACREQECVLTGGETSEQPGVLEAGTYILTANIVGVVEKSRIIDGSKITEGDAVLAVASNGLHTNGYSLLRKLTAQRPEVLKVKVGGEPFLEAILRPHKCYYKSFRGLFNLPHLHGMAHITGGGIEGNLNRILPRELDAVVELGKIKVPEIFKVIQRMGDIEYKDMLRTFNMGVGMTLVVEPKTIAEIHRHLKEKGCESYVIGKITKGHGKVIYQGKLNI